MESRGLAVHVWALRRVVEYLEAADGARLLVYAIQFHDAELLDLLLHGDQLWAKPVDILLVLHEAAASSCWKAVEWALERMKPIKTRRGHKKPTRELMIEARKDSVIARVIQKQRRLGYTFPAQVLYEAATRGHRSAVTWLHSRTSYVTHVAMDHAARHGHLELVEWIFYQCCNELGPDGESVKLVLGLDQGLDVVMWLVSTERTGTFACCATLSGLLPRYQVSTASSTPFYPLLGYAAGHNDRELVLKLLRHPIASQLDFQTALPLAAAYGNRDLVHWLISQSHTTKPELVGAMVAAAKHNEVEVLKYLHEAAPAWLNTYAIPRLHDQLRVAAAHGAQEVVTYLVEERDVEVSSRVFETTAHHGHLNLLQWLVARAAISTPVSVMRSAVTGGKGAVVQWLTKTFRVSNNGVIRDAAHANQVEILAWFWQYILRDVPLEQGRVALVQESLPSLTELLDDSCLDVAIWCVENRLLPSPVFDKGDLQRMHEWFNRSAESMVDLNRFLRSFLENYPDEARSLHWLPTWAIHTGFVEAMSRLEAIQHPHLHTKRTLRTILHHTRDSRMMLWILHRQPSLLNDPQITRWALQHGLVDLCATIMASGPKISTTWLRSALWQATRNGHVTLLKFLQSRIHEHRACPHDLFRGLDSLAKRANQPQVSVWLRTLELDQSPCHQPSGSIRPPSIETPSSPPTTPSNTLHPHPRRPLSAIHTLISC